MNSLLRSIRPVQVFDATNRKHRESFAKYVATNSWNHSDVKYVANQPTQSDVGVMTRQLVEFYTKKEFAKTKKIG